MMVEKWEPGAFRGEDGHMYVHVYPATIRVKARYVAEVQAMLDAFEVGFRTYPGRGWFSLTVIRTDGLRLATARQVNDNFRRISRGLPWRYPVG